MREHLTERLVVLLTSSEKDILKELAYQHRKSTGQFVRDLIRAEIVQSGIVAPVPTEAEEDTLLARVP